MTPLEQAFLQLLEKQREAVRKDEAAQEAMERFLDKHGHDEVSEALLDAVFPS